MSLLGHIAGGLLQGAGTGITQDAIARRTEALEAMRQRYQTQREDVAHERTVERDETQHRYRTTEADQAYDNQAGLLGLGNELGIRRDRVQSGLRITEIRTQQIGQQELARIQGQIDIDRITREHGLTRDDVIGAPVRGDDGLYYLPTRGGGLIPTSIRAAPTSAELNDTGGGTLSDSEQREAYNAARRAWVQGGSEGPEPQRSDFIGMSREEYRRTRGGGPAPSPSPTGSSRQRTPGTLSPRRQSRVMSVQDYTRLINEASSRAANGDPEWAGLNGEQTRAKLAELAAARGLTLPEIR